MVAGDGVDGAVDQPFTDGVDIGLRAQRRVHLEHRVEVLAARIGQREVLRRDLGGDRKTARLGRTVGLSAREPELDETWALLRALPERQRMALVLRFYEDLSEAEIARLLECRPGTVKSLIHRGLAKVRKDVIR